MKMYCKLLTTCAIGVLLFSTTFAARQSIQNTIVVGDWVKATHELPPNVNIHRFAPKETIDLAKSQLIVPGEPEVIEAHGFDGLLINKNMLNALNKMLQRPLQTKIVATVYLNTGKTPRRYYFVPFAKSLLLNNSVDNLEKLLNSEFSKNSPQELMGRIQANFDKKSDKLVSIKLLR